MVLLASAMMVFIVFSSMTPPQNPPLGAGVTAKPNTNYADDEPAHNTRIADPYEQLVPTLSSNVPVNLKPHSRLVLSDIEDRTFFDFFAWQTFVGLVWPADPDYRGVANSDVTADNFKEYNTTNSKTKKANRVPVVWETFQDVDVALPNPPASGPAPSQPEAWNATPYTRPFDLDYTSKGNNPAELDEAFSSPLIDQNRQYVRYNLQLNEVMYEFIRQNKWYLKGNLPKSPTQASLPPLPVDPATGEIMTVQQPQTNTTIIQPVNGNSIEIKSSWRIMITEEDPSKPWRKVDDLSRYYVSTANVQDPVTGEEIPNQLVGLVGLHVVVKTPQFTQGVWCTFEQIDNVKAPDGGRASFNSDGTFQPNGYSYQPKSINSPSDVVPESDRVPVEVSRIYKIPNTPVGTSPTLPNGLSTQGLNTAFQELLSGTVWQYYQLVITQWPTDPTTFYAMPFLYPRGFPPYSKIDPSQPQAVKDAYARANAAATNSYPKFAGLPIPQVGCLNTTMETYFQNPSTSPMENTSCMGCHFGASDTDFSWALKLRTWPQPYNQGRVNPEDSDLSKEPANTN